MRRRATLTTILTLLLVLPALLSLGACSGDRYSTTVNIYGPFRECTAIVVPLPSGGNRTVHFGDRDVSVTGSNTIQVGTTAYTVDLAGCGATTTTTTTTTAAQAKS
jgi:hypothetical protein